MGTLHGDLDVSLRHLERNLMNVYRSENISNKCREK
jgi:hypothetical protein